MKPRAVLIALALAAAVALLLVPAASALRPTSCNTGACRVVKHNLTLSWGIAKTYASSHGGTLPRRQAFVNAVLDTTAGLDPAVGGEAKAARLHDPAAVLIDPNSTRRRTILWGRSASGIVVKLGASLRGGVVFHTFQS